MRDLLEFDLDQLDLRRGLTGLLGLAVALGLVGVLGPVAMAAGIAALFVVAGDSEASPGPDRVQVALVVAGVAVTYVVGSTAGSGAAATITLTLVTLVTTLVALSGPRWAAAGTYALLWAVLTLSIGPTEESPAAMALAFAAGGAIALGALWVAARWPTGPAEDADAPDRPAAPPTPDRGGQAAWAVEAFAVVRALAAGVCVALGYRWFPEHPSWALLTFVLVLRPPREQAIVVGVQRTVGTTVGVVLGVLVARAVGDATAGLLAAFALSGFLMLATRDVNYALSTTFTTSLILVAERLLQEDVFSTGWQRLLATALGVAAAFAVLGVLHLLSTRRGSGERTPPA